MKKERDINDARLKSYDLIESIVQNINRKINQNQEENSFFHCFFTELAKEFKSFSNHTPSDILEVAYYLIEYLYEGIIKLETLTDDDKNDLKMTLVGFIFKDIKFLSKFYKIPLSKEVIVTLDQTYPKYIQQRKTESRSNIIKTKPKEIKPKNHFNHDERVKE